MKFFLNSFLYFYLISPQEVNSFRTYQIIFPGGETFSYAKLVGTIDRPLNDFTLCHWSRSNTARGLDAGVFSYATENNNDSLVTYIKHNQRVRFIKDDAVLSDIKISLGSTFWLHLCGTWSLAENRRQVFINGELLASNTSDEKKPLLPNGIVILGQDQDEFGGGFHTTDSLMGQISEVHLWDSVLTPRKIQEIYKCQSGDTGNVIGWHRSSWALYNGSIIAPVVLPCGEPQ